MKPTTDYSQEQLLKLHDDVSLLTNLKGFGYIVRNSFPQDWTLPERLKELREEEKEFQLHCVEEKIRCFNKMKEIKGF